MGVKLKRKAGKKVTHVVTIRKTDNTEKRVLSVETGCKTFGSMMLNDAFGYVGKCKKCANDIKEACSVKTSPAIKMASGKVGGSSQRPFDVCVGKYLDGVSKEKMIEFLTTDDKMGEKPAKRFVADIFSVGNAAKGEARKKGGLIDLYCTWAIKGKGKGTAPEGCKITIGFCKQFCASYVKILAAKA